MVLNIKLFRNSNQNLDVIRNSVSKRFKDPSVVDQLVAANEERLKTNHNVETIKKYKNDVQYRIRGLAQQKKVPSDKTPLKPNNFDEIMEKKSDDLLDNLTFNELLYIKNDLDQLDTSFLMLWIH